MNYSKKIFLGFAILFSMTEGLVAQEQTRQLEFRKIGIEQGLSYPGVLCLLQDSKGFLWFGTKDGLNRYDGYEMKVYRSERNTSNHSTALSASRIQTLYEDREGFLWIGTHGGGICRFDRRTETFISYRHDPKNGQSISSDYVYSIFQDHKGQLWVGTLGGGLNLFDPISKQFKTFQKKLGFPRSLPNNSVLAIHEDRRHTLWIGTLGGGLTAFNPEQNLFTTYQHTESDSTSLPSNTINIIYEDKAGTLWLGTGGKGLVRVDVATHQFKTYAHEAANPNSLSNDYVSDIQEDKRGVLWVATKGGGLCQFDKRKEVFTSYLRNPAIPLSLSNNDITDLCLDKAGNLWLATDGGGICTFETHNRQIFQAFISKENSRFVAQSVTAICQDQGKRLWIGTLGNGLYLYDMVSEKFVSSQQISSLWPSSTDTVTALAQDRHGHMWIGTKSRGIYRWNEQTKQMTPYLAKPDEATSLSSNAIETLLKDRQGNIWVGTRHGLCRYNETNDRFAVYLHDSTQTQSIGGNVVKAIYQSLNGLVWIGTEGAGFSVFDPKTETFANYPYSPEQPDGLCGSTITSILETKNGVIWLGTDQNGISKFDPKTHIFNTINSHIGLPHNTICSLLKDSHQNIWISTPEGLSCFDWEKKQFKRYSTNSGLPTSQFSPGASYISPTGQLFWGATQHLITYIPMLDTSPINESAPVYLTVFRLLDKKKDFGIALSEMKEITLEHSDNFLSFEFVLLDYQSPSQNQYAYQLEGLDKAWNYIGNRRLATYTNMDPGEYTFRVKAAGKNGVWSNQIASIKVIIYPAWYHTWWFRTLVTMTILGICYSYYLRRIHVIEKQKVRLENQVMERTADLHEEKSKVEQAYQAMSRQQDDLVLAYSEINAQKEELQRQSYHITSSINYAKRIQESILPLQEQIKKALPDSFILLKPRNIVSGDFYWFAQKGESYILAVIDCTGHGVPGAFMSMVGNSLLNQIVNELNIIRPAEILRRLHQGVRSALRQNDTDEGSPDGMDIALCMIHPHLRLVEFAGANRPLWYISQQVVEEIKPTGGSIGGLIHEGEGVYTYHSLEITEPTNFYLFTDGYADQFGGDRRRKFMLKNFKNQLVGIQLFDFEVQREILDNTLEEWKAAEPQTDDILVIGFRVE